MTSAARPQNAEIPSRPATAMTILAYATIYLVWGSTFLAIRIGVAEVPPFLLAAMRFVAAGLVLFLWAIVRGEQAPSGRQWASTAVLAILIFVLDYGLLFWAEQRVPSGLAAVMMATTPAFMALSEVAILGTQKLTPRLAAALAVGIVGVAVLVAPWRSLGGVPIDPIGAAALVFASMSWSVGSTLLRKLPMPSSKVMSSGAQMLAGGILLAVTATGLGELSSFHPSRVSAGAWLSLAYLVVAGSIVAFTAYVWLIHHQSPTKVGTSAYVNPVVAVLLGYFLGSEALGARAVAATALILVSVVAIVGSPKTRGGEALPAADAPRIARGTI